MKAAVALTALTLSACDPPALPPCGPVPEVEPASGVGTSGAATSLVPGAEQLRIEISSDRTKLEYRFNKDGATYVARYDLSRQPPPPAIRFVTLRRQAPTPSCAEQLGRGPVIDALEVRRAGLLVAHGEAFNYGFGSCPDKRTTGRKVPVEWSGSADGKAFALGDGTITWRLSAKATLQPGDVIELKTLGDSVDALDILGSQYRDLPGTVLGTLLGGGTVAVP